MSLGQPNVESMFSEVFIDILRITKLGLFLGYIVYRIRYLLNMSVVDGCISTGKSGKRSWKSNPNALLETDSPLSICCNSTGVLSGSWHILYDGVFNFKIVLARIDFKIHF